MRRPHVQRLASSDDELAWLKHRKQYLTASDVAAVCRKNPYKKPQEVLLEKLSTGASLVSSMGDIIRGKVLEDVILSIAPQWGYKAPLRNNRSLYTNLDYPWLAATPDAFTVAPCRNVVYGDDGAHVSDEYAMGVVDVKAPRKLWEQLPEYIVYQIRAQMIVCECSFGVVIAGAYSDQGMLCLKTYHVRYDEESEDTILNETEKFWETVMWMRGE